MSDEFQKHYELQELIGEGGLAAVYKIRRKDTASIYAFKKLKDNSPLNLDALDNEYQFLKSHRHPGVVEVFELVDSSDRRGFVSEYVEGVSLQALCGRLDEQALLTTLSDLLEIAAFIHQRGYIYNDYKPQNFIRRFDGCLKLIDFNLVQRPDSTSLNSCGTLEYLAPEVIRGGRVSPLSDIYSLGVTIYELISGHLPFVCPDQDSLIKSIAESAPTQLTGSHEKWNTAIQQMLSKSPSDRPGSIYETAGLFGLCHNLEMAVKKNARYYLHTDSKRPSINEEGANDSTNADNRGKLTGSVVDKLLKKHSLDKTSIALLTDWSEGDEQIIYDYLLYLIETDYIKFAARGWVATAPIESSILPETVRSRHLDKLKSLGQNETEIIEWLSILDIPLDRPELEELTSIMQLQIDHELRKLIEGGLIIEKDNRYRIINRSLLLTIYDCLESNRRGQMHKRAAKFLRVHEPTNHELLAYHYYQVPEFGNAFEHGYLAAAELLKKDELKKAGRFLDLALKAAAELPKDCSNNHKIAELYLLAGDLAKRTGDNKTAEKKYLEAINLIAASGDEKLLALIYKNIGDLYRRGQRSAESIEYSSKALEIFGRLQDRPLQAACLNNLSLAYWLMGEYATALDYLSKALKINEELGDLLEQSKIHSNIGFISDLVGNTSQVLLSFARALECARSIKNHYQEMVGLNNIGFFHLNSGNPSKALEFFEQALSIALRHNYVDQQLNLESNIAWAYHEMGNLIKSAEANQKTLDIALANQHELFAAQSSYLLGRDCLAMGNYRLADRMLTQARKICAEISNNDLAIDILLGQIELALATGDSQRAGHLLDDFQSRKNPGKKQILTGGLYRARWLALKCDNNAELEYNKLIEQIIEPEFFDITINAITDLAQIKLSAGALDQARQLIARLDSFKVQNVLMILQMQITQGGLYRKLRQFDDALDTIKSVKKQAEISGCMPEYFRACLIEAEIYRDCGKNANLAIIIARLEKMHLAMLRSFPEERQTASLQNLPYINRYLKLLSVSADKAVAAKI